MLPQNGYYQTMSFFQRQDIEAAYREALIMREDYRGDSVVYENDEETVRSIFDMQNINHRLFDLVCTDKLVEHAMRILDDDVYVHQFHVNYKQAFTGGAYDWHSDYTYWHWEDGMPQPRCLSFVIPLEDMRYENGPLYVHPGSHLWYGHSEFYRDQRVHPNDEIKHDEQDPGGATADQREMMKDEAVRGKTYGGPMHVMLASPGDLLIMDANLLHMSQHNWSPWDRACAFLCLNSYENRLLDEPPSGTLPRPTYLSSRDFTVL